MEQRGQSRAGTLICLRHRPDLGERAAQWFHRRWGVPAAAYLESMAACAAGETAVPQWYLLLDGQGQIAAGAGVIENDFHDRADLAPNLCALYVEEAYRGQGAARYLLDHVRRDMAALGVGRLYLVTDHTDFYEKCGWRFLTMVRDAAGQPERMYTADTK